MASERDDVTLRRLLLAACLLPGTAWADAAAPAPCGTVIVPPGVGTGTGPADVTSLNPFLITSLYNGEAAGLLYESLLWVNRRHTITWSRSLATSVAITHDDTVFTVTMRPWRWSDGVPVTTRDVTFTFDLIKRLGKTYPGYGQGGIPTLVKSLDVLGPHRFRVVLKHKVNPTWFELTGLSQLQPFPAHEWAKYSVDRMWRLQSTPSFFKVVDGPYKIQKFMLGRYISFVPNPTYQGHGSEIARFVMRFLNAPGAEIEGLKTGTLDASNLPFSLWQAGRALKGIRVLKLTPQFGFQLIYLNFRNKSVPFFRDVRIRQAMEDAIDQTQYIRVLLHDTTQPQWGPVPVDPPTFLSPEAKAGNYPVGYDPAKARRLLDAAGWKQGRNGIREKGGKKLAFTIVIPSGSVTGTLTTELQQADLRKVGIAMTIRELNFNQEIALLYKPKQWQAMAFGWSMGAYPDNAAQFATDGAYNQSGYSDGKMDRLLQAVTTEPGLKALYAYQNYASAQQPELFQANPGVVVLVRKGLRGVRKFISPTGAWSPQYLHWTTGACARPRASGQG